MNRVVGGRPASEPDAAVGDPDGALLVAARRDPEAFGSFFDRNYGIVVRYFGRRTACAHTAADLTAETFAAALGGLHRYNPTRGSGRAWLFGIASNEFKQWLRLGHVEARHRHRLGMLTMPVDGADLDRIEALIDLTWISERLRTALGLLSQPVAAAVVLRVVEGLPYAEVASRIGCSEVNARVRVARGLDRLSTLLEEP